MITKTYKRLLIGLSFIICHLSFSVALTSCSPESFDGPDQNGIPSISGVDFDMNVDQTVNQATIKVTNMPPATYAIWVVNGSMYSTLNPMNWANNKAGTYDVELRLGNRNGFSQGSISKSFTFDNSQIDLTPYFSRISRTWRINYAEQGHMGCGEPGTDGSNWWSAAPNDKADWGVYDDRLTFTEDGTMTYDPGDGGTVYVNNGASLFPEYNNLKGDDGNPIDFTAPVDVQNSTYGFDVEGDKIVLKLAPKTLFPYLSSDDQYNNPVFTVIKLTNSEMVLLYEGNGITWRFMLTSKEDGNAPFMGFKAKSEFNMWRDITPDMSFYYNPDPGWGNEQTNAFAALFKGGNNNYDVTIPEACYAEWQAQVHFHTNLSTSAANHYDFSVILSTDRDIDGVVVKLTNEEDTEAIIDEHNVNLKAGDDYVFWKSDLEGKDLSKVKLVFDFGHATGETHVNIKNVVLKDHANDDGTVLPTDQPSGPEEPSVNWVAVDSPENIGAGFNKAGSMSFWWADAGWNQIGDPEFSYSNGVYTIKAKSATANEWQAQCAINGVPLQIEEGQAYDVRVKIVANQDLGRMTVKVNKDPDVTNDPNTLCYKGDFKLEEGENYLEMIGVVAKNGADLISFDQGKFILDFGGCPEGFEAKVSDIIIQKHKAEVAMSYDDANNLWKAVDNGTAFKGTATWFADGGWSQLATQPEIKHDGKTWSLTVPEGTGGSQWQGQVKIFTTLSAAQNDPYNFQCTLVADNDIAGATIKFTQSDVSDSEKHDDNFYFDGRHDLQADEPFVYKAMGVTLPKGDAHEFTMVFDFGGAPAGTHITISDIIFEKAE